MAQVTDKNPAEERFLKASERLLGRYNANATSRSLELKSPALRVHLLEAGQGKPVLYLHGHGGTGADLAPLLSSLQSHLRIYAPTRPGSGLSDKINYRGIDLRHHSVKLWTQVLDLLELEKVAIIGTSLGGLEAAWLALDHPERVSRLVFLGGAAGFDRWANFFFKVSSVPLLNRIFHGVLAKPGPGTTKRLFQALVANPDRVPEEFREYFTANMLMPGWTRSWLSLVEEAVTLRGFSPRYYVGDTLASIQQPALLVWGYKDGAVRLASGRQAAQVMPHAILEAIEDAGHLPWLDEPQRCTDLIINFLKK